MKRTPINEAPLRHRQVQSPFGDLGLVASTRGLVRLAFDGDEIFGPLEERNLSTLSVRSEGEGPASLVLNAAEEQLTSYFAGERRSFAIVLDLAPVLPGTERTRNPFVPPRSGFRTAAQIALLNVCYGETASYGEIADLLGSPRAARAVGSACATNPLPIFLPCHRVVRRDGKLGHYTGGSEWKRELLNLEAGNKKWS